MNRKWIQASVFAASTLAALAFAPEAQAEPMTHDGFYLQLGVGLGYLSSTATADGFDGDETMSGVSIPSALMLGGTIGPVVIGGGFFGDYAPSPSYSRNGSDLELDNVTMTLVGIGMFADVYPNPNEGLHFQPFIGWGGLEVAVDGDAGGSDPTGLVMALGVGYDFWVSPEWSIGPMFRIAYAPLSRDNFDYSTLAPVVMATFTYH